MSDDPETFAELFAPAVQRFEVAAAINGRAVWNAEGSKAMAQLLKETAAAFDQLVAHNQGPRDV